MERVRRHAVLGFFSPDYDPYRPPHDIIYGKISHGQAWTPTSAYYVSNPYHLVVLTAAGRTTPLPVLADRWSLVYDAGLMTEEIQGEGARRLFQQVYDSAACDLPGVMNAIMVNAYDAGFHFAHVDGRKSVNIGRVEDAGSILNGLYSQPSFYHVGRYAKNNISPKDPRGFIPLVRRDVRTEVWVRLWRKRPPSLDRREDLRYGIRILP